MRVLFFAHLKEITGRAEVDWDIRRPLDTAGLWRRLIAAYPGLAEVRASVRLARNSEYAGPETGFRNGDEVALIPPVSGG